MIDYIILLSTGAMVMASFYLGAIIGQKTAKEEPIKVPTITGVIQEHKEQKIIQAEKERFDTMMQNIDNYDGTALGQQDVRW